MDRITQIARSLARWAGPACAATWLLLATPGAQARETEHFFEVSQAVGSKLGRSRLLEVPFYMKGQEGAPEATQLLGTWTQERSFVATRKAVMSPSCRH